MLIYAITESHSIVSRIEEVERMLADQQLMFEDEKIKMKSTIEQQTKLIDFLQAKTDNSKKKKVSWWMPSLYAGQLGCISCVILILHKDYLELL